MDHTRAGRLGKDQAPRATVCAPLPGSRLRRSPLNGLLLLTLLTACAGDSATADPQADRAHYQAGLTRGDTQQRLEHCRAVIDETLRSDCLTALAGRTAQLTDLDADVLCGEIQLESWRDECFFMAAEQARANNDLGGAATLCAKAGRFVRDCSNHLWQRELRQAIHPGGIAILVERHDDVQAIRDRWSEAFEGAEDFEKRFWEHCFQVAFERSRHIDIDACDRVPEAERETCLMSAETTYRGWLNEAMTAPESKTRLCATDRSTLQPSLSATLLQTGSAPDHPRLLDVLQRFHDTRCSRDRKGLPPG